MSVSSFSIKQVRSADFIHVVMISVSVVLVEDLGSSILVFSFLCVIFYTVRPLYPKCIYLDCVFVTMSVYIKCSEFTGCVNLLEFSQQRALHHHTYGSCENILCINMQHLDLNIFSVLAFFGLHINAYMFW